MKFLKNVALSLVLCIALVIFSYHFLDQPIALFVDHHNLPTHSIFEWMSRIANAILIISTLFLIVLSTKSILRPLSRLHKQLFTSSLAIIVAVFFRVLFGSLFYRYWVRSGVDSNPTFIGNQVYGFTLLHAGSHGSFPSGHTAMTFCAMTFLWILLPKWRPLAIFLCLIEIVGLISMNYHFLSDVIAGAFLGIVCALFAQKMHHRLG